MLYKFYAPGSAYMVPVADMLATLTPKPTTIALFYGNDPFSISVFKVAFPHTQQSLVTRLFTIKPMMNQPQIIRLSWRK